MTVFSELLKGGAEGLLKGVGSLAKNIREAVTGKTMLDAAQIADLQKMAMELESKVLEADVAIAKGQMEINKADAESGSFFRGGWRPSVGWICSFALLYTFILRPILPWIFQTAGYQAAPLPPVDTQTLMTLLLGMLGLGGFRTYEKVKGLK